MFDVDLMNRPGIQKIISKVNIDSNLKKQEIVFGNLESNEEKKNLNFTEDKNDNGQTSSISIVKFIYEFFFLLRYPNSLLYFFVLI